MRNGLIALFLMVFGITLTLFLRSESRLYIDHFLYRFRLGQALVRTDTRYGPNYSEAKFRKIRVGDSAEVVRPALGEPLAHFTNGPGAETFMYSFHRSDRDIMYWKSRIICTSNGVVVEKLSFVND